MYPFCYLFSAQNEKLLNVCGVGFLFLFLMEEVSCKANFKFPSFFFFLIFCFVLFYF